MKQFAALINAIDQSTKTTLKVEALVAYLKVAEDQDILWALALFSGRKPKRTVTATLLADWATDLANIPDWLFKECHQITGDLAETIALLLPAPTTVTDHSLTYYLGLLTGLEKATIETKRDTILNAWEGLLPQERFVFNKLITGNFRIGVSQQLLIRALGIYLDRPAAEVAHRLMGGWHPSNTTLQQLLHAEDTADTESRPYPFFLAYPLEGTPDTLGYVDLWQAEWKWDGIRGQIIKRNDALYIWSRGEELITEKFPEFDVLKGLLPNGTVLDGEIIGLDAGGLPLPFNALQTRIGRKTLTSKILAACPVGLITYDLLEFDGIDIRAKPLSERYLLLQNLVTKVNQPNTLVLSDTIQFDSWAQLTEIRKESRNFLAEGLMLKSRNSAYGTGRKKGFWWKWKVAPLVIDAVLIYAQRGHGRRANLYTDFTFAVWDAETGLLVPFTKAYSGLTDKELVEVDAFVKKNTKEKFGPVRSVTPELVFEIAFEGIAASPRHKSGIALRFPRINRWRKDKTMAEADTLVNLQQILKQYGGTAEE